MAKLTMTTFVTLDGVMQAPGAPDEDRSGGFPHGGWFVPFADADMGTFMTEVFANADAFLLGRRTSGGLAQTLIQHSLRGGDALLWKGDQRRGYRAGVPT